MRSSWFMLRHAAEGAFWRGTAAAAGFAAHHRRQMRLVPVGVLAAAAFVIGRLAGEALFR